MNYREALSFVHSRQKFGSRPGLDSIRRITELCDNPQRDMRFIHIAGTNGKGSISTMLSNILIESNKKTGLYISPYVIDFRERIQINGEMISKADFARIITFLAPFVKRVDSEGLCVTEFELITCAAFIYFKEKGCDFAVLEVGMGGRLDATNIIESPEVSVITRIDLDHTAVLGDTVSQIAAEKCGIIKKGTPIVMYPDQYEEVSYTIKNTAQLNGSELVVPSIDFIAEDKAIFGSRVNYKGIEFNLRLIGAHQRLNAITAIEAAFKIGISSENIVSGIEKTSFAARMELICDNPVVLLDGAHNPNGAKALSSALRDIFGDKKVVAIMGMLADKDVDETLGILAPCFSDIIAVKVPNPRTMTASELKKVASKYCSSVTVAGSYSQAIALSRSIAGDRPVIVCGSLYLASAIRPKLIKFYK
ncbi:MAG: bifunctional folylpolyglutamate synthase/dihydrofolate synthase [Clostridia bacterium]|nr:bifunctional folylpolyglutamate synthase/dihydrofolate synthase [Clostridia bacterium]